METVGDRIRKTRRENYMTQKTLADKIGIDASLLTRIELNKRKIKNDELTKIADLFNVSTDYLLAGKEKEETPEDKFIKLLTDKTIENKIKWINLEPNIQIELKDNIIKYDRIVEMLDAFIPPDKSINDGYKIKLTSINDKIIIFKYDKSEECQELIYGTSTYINSIEDYGFNNELLTKLCLYLFEPVIYNKNNSISSLIDDLENL